MSLGFDPWLAALVIAVVATGGLFFQASFKLADLAREKRRRESRLNSMGGFWADFFSFWYHPEHGAVARRLVWAGIAFQVAVYFLGELLLQAESPAP